MEAESRILRKELHSIENRIKAAAIGENAEAETLKLMVRREMLPALIAAAEQAERLAARHLVHP